MAYPFRQTDFSGGYLSPQLYGRTDHEKYQKGLAECRNMTIQRYSGAENRAGSLYCGATRFLDFQGIPFITSIAQSYSMEVGAGYTRMWQDGAPLSAAGCPAFSAGITIPNGQIVSQSGAYWYALCEQWQGGPAAVTISGSSYATGAVLTLTSGGAPLWTADMAMTGAVMKVQVPGGTIITLTIRGFVSADQVTASSDQPIPTYLQAVPTVFWTCTAQIYGVVYLGSNGHPSTPTDVLISITSGSGYAAGTTLTLTANVGFFSDEMVTGAQVFTFPTANGPLQITINGYTSGTSATGVGNIAVPAGLQATPIFLWSNPTTASFLTFSALGPNAGPGVQFPPNSITLTLTTTGGYNTGAVLAVVASTAAFTSGMPAAGQAFTLYDGLGVSVVLIATTFTDTEHMTMTAQGPVPLTLQGVPIVFWSAAVTAPVAGPYWYELTGSQVEIPSVMPASCIGAISYAQANDVMTLAHQSFATVQLLHFSASRWLLQNYIPGAAIGPPIGLSAQIGFGPPDGSTLHTFAYVVTSVDSLTGEESVASNPVVCVGNYASPTLPNRVAWSAVPGAKYYNIYNISGGVAGLVGSVSGQNGTFFNDTGFIPDIQNQPPVPIPMFQTINDYPGVCSFFQQRLLLANSPNQPQTLWATRVGQLSNMNISTPLVDSDAIQATLAGSEVQPIMAMVDLQNLVIHTSNAEYVCRGNVNGAISPVTGINANRQSHCGSAAVRPIAIGITDLFVQARGTQVRDLKYDIRSYCYATSDLTIFCPDLFTGRTVVGMAWQQVPNSIVWFVLSDGSLLSLTYIHDQGIWAWGTHDTGGDPVFQAWVVQEGIEDVLYIGVTRTILGTPATYIERISQRDFIDTTYLTDATFCDSYQIYDGRNTNPAVSLTLTSQTGGWTAQDVFTLTMTGAATFAATDAAAGNPQGVANSFLLRQLNTLGVDTSRLYFTVLAYTSTTQVTVGTNAAVPTWARSVALTAWGKAQHAFSGMDHLDGRAISVLGDGNVLASPLSPDAVFSGAPVVVASGAFVIPGAQAGADPNSVNCMVVCAGLPILAELTTLPLENQKGDTILGKQKTIREMTPTFYNSRGGWYGQLNESGQKTTLQSWKQRMDENLGLPTQCFSGSIRLDNISADWGARGQGTGQVVLQQPDPVPFGLSALTELAEVGN